jgi:hypothetical protein
MNVDAIRAQLAKIQQSTSDIDKSTAIIYTLLNDPTVINVGVNDNLLSLIDSAPVGSVFSIDKNFVFSGDLVVNKPLTMMSASPIAGRVDKTFLGPTFIGAMDVKAPNVSLINLLLTSHIKEQTILSTGDKFLAQSCLVKGSTTGQHRGIRTDSAGIVVSQCYIYNIFETIDTQAIAGWNGCKNLFVDDCYLEASGENVLFGGADPDNESMIPQDITIKNCDMFKPLAWKTTPGITVKNLFEIKNAKRVKVTNCRMTNSWTSGQVGYGILVNVRNQDGNAPFSTIQDVVFDGCLVSAVGAGIQILGQDYAHPSGILTNLTFSNNHFEFINGSFGAGRQILISRGGKGLQFLNNNFKGTSINSAMNFDDPTLLCEALEVSGNTFDEGDYGIFGTGAPGLGKVVLDMYAPAYKWSNNTIRKGTSGRNIVYPPGTIIV